MEQALLHVWRPEAVDDPDDPISSPFDGVETYLMASEKAASDLAEELADQHPMWRFHVDTAVPWSSTLGAFRPAKS